jgi:hypothetical protein
MGFSGIAVPAIWNRYSYVIDNPVNYTDPLGLECRWNPATKTLTCPTLPGGGAVSESKLRRAGTDFSDDEAFRRVTQRGFATASLMRVSHVGLRDCEALRWFAQAALDLSEGHGTKASVESHSDIQPLPAACAAWSGSCYLKNSQHSGSGGETADQAHHFAFYILLSIRPSRRCT